MDRIEMARRAHRDGWAAVEGVDRDGIGAQVRAAIDELERREPWHLTREAVWALAGALERADEACPGGAGIGGAYRLREAQTLPCAREWLAAWESPRPSFSWLHAEAAALAVELRRYAQEVAS